MSVTPISAAPSAAAIANAWTTAAPGVYDPTEIRTVASDTKGHSVDQRVKIQPSLSGRIGELIASKQVPQYRSAADFIRDAIFHRLHYINEAVVSDPEFQAAISSAVKAARYADFIASMRAEIETAESLATTTEEICRLASEREDWEGLAATLDRCYEQMDGFRDPYYGRIKAILDKYTGLLPEAHRIR